MLIPLRARFLPRAAPALLPIRPFRRITPFRAAISDSAHPLRATLEPGRWGDEVRRRKGCARVEGGEAGREGGRKETKGVKVAS